MELRHEFTVPVPAAEAWRVLLDIERVALCLPGATVTGFDGETMQGSVKVTVGPMTVTYRGTAAFEERDASARRIVLVADGKEARGHGTARARVTGTLVEHGEGEESVTTVTATTDLTVTGHPAQFGRGVLAEAGDKLIGRFADCLSRKLAESAPEPVPAPGEAPTPGAVPAAVPVTEHAHPNGDGPSAAAPPEGSEDGRPFDLSQVAGLPAVRRAAGVAAGLAGLAALRSCLRRRRAPRRR